VTKKKHRALEALRRLGAEPPPPDPNFKCHYRTFGFGDPCKETPARMRKDHAGVLRWYCPHHDPIRIAHEQRNKKKREAEKKARWQQIERERKP